MHFSTFTLAALNAMALLSTSTATPIPHPSSNTTLTTRDKPCTPCRRYTDYTINNQFSWNSAFHLIHGYSRLGACELAECHEFGVGLTIETGIDLGLDIKEIFHAGVSASVSTETTNTVTSQVSLSCPAGVHCGAMHQDAIYMVQGYKKQMQECPFQPWCNIGEGVKELSSAFYEVWYSKVGDDGVPVTDMAICACPESHATAPEGMWLCVDRCDSSA